MSAIISSDVQMKEILKATGFDCPEELQDKTFAEATSGGGGSGGGGATITKKLNAKEIRTSVERGQAITPPEGYDGFSEITFPSSLMQEIAVTKNQTLEFGTTPTPYFLKKLTVNVPSNYTLETLDLDKNSEPVTISYEGKAFVFLGSGNYLGELTGIGGIASELSVSGLPSVPIMSAGITAGTVSSDPNTKTITFTPDTSFNRGSYRIIKVII